MQKATVQSKQSVKVWGYHELTSFCSQDFAKLPHADKIALKEQPYNFLEQVGAL